MRLKSLALLIPVIAAAAFSQDLKDPALLGDKKKAEQVWSTVKKWTSAYSNRDLKGVMEIFDRDEVFSFAGGPDASYSDLEADYRSEFAKAKAGGGSDWVTLAYEVYAEGKTAFVRGIAEFHVKSPDGTVKIGDRNRCIDIYRLHEGNEWRIFRTMCYPEPKKEK